MSTFSWNNSLFADWTVAADWTLLAGASSPPPSAGDTAIINIGTVVVTEGQVPDVVLIGAAGEVLLSGGTLDASVGGTTDDGLIAGQGTLDGSIGGIGTVLASGGTLVLGGNITTSTLSLVIDNTAASTLTLEGTVAAGTTVTFDAFTGNMETLRFGNSTALTSFTNNGTIAGLNLGPDSSTATTEIDLATLPFANGTFTTGTTYFQQALFVNGNTLEIIDTAGGHTDFVLASAPAATTIIDAISDGSGGTDIFLQTQTEAAQVSPTVAEGTDYLTTASGTNFIFGPGVNGGSAVLFQGVPVGPGSTDTIVERLNDATIGGPAINISIVALSMTSIGTVVVDNSNTLGLAQGTYDIDISLDPGNLANDVGTMAITGDLTGGSWTNQFTVDFQAHFIPVVGGSDATGFIEKIFTGSGTWSSTATAGDLIIFGPDDESSKDFAANKHSGLDSNEVDFFLTNIGTHDTGGGSHNVSSALCFTAGTLIRTECGEVPVERLAVGDLVVTSSGQSRPIKWIGTGKVLVTRGCRSAATPVVVRKGALADNVPNRDLRVTKGHSLYLNGVLIPVEFLVNHRSITWDDHAREVAIFHIELETHDILLANGAPAESYRDDGNRWLFHNANSGWDLAALPPCAPVVTGGPVVDALWRELLERAGPRPGIPMTEDADLHLQVDGVRVDAMRRQSDRYFFRVPASPHEVRIVSRVGVPAELGIARDPRPLGVALRRIVVSRGAQISLAEADDPVLADGFHLFEATDNLRWTDGNASVPPELFQEFHGAVELELHIAGTTSYPLFSEDNRRAAA